MRPPLPLLMVLFIVGASAAQAPYPTTTSPEATWGGYTLPAQVPYQPTLPSDAAALCTPANAVDADQMWQGYPPSAGVAPYVVTPDGIIPGAAPAIVPQDSVYPTPSEPSLRQSLIPPDARDGFFQKAKFTATWLPQLDSFSLGWTDLRTEVVTALPFFTRENPIVITPSYELHFLKAPTNFELPARLHDIATDFHIFRVFDNHWIADFAVTPGLYSDDSSFDSAEALRINGRAVGIYAPSIDLKWVLGVTYVDGGWAKVVPVAGVVYKPDDDVEYQLVFPSPRVSWRLPNSPVPGRDERWLYVAAEFGNSAWAFQQNDGDPDVLASRDYRLILGVERKIVGGLSQRLEIGYVFNRDIKIASVSGDDISLNDTFLLRAGITY